jgi:hypothetical protein
MRFNKKGLGPAFLTLAGAIWVLSATLTWGTFNLSFLQGLSLNTILSVVGSVMFFRG